MPIKHKFQSGRADNGDAGAIQPSAWDDEHDLDGMLSILDQLTPTPNVVVTLDGSMNLQLKATADFAPTFSPALTGAPTAPTAPAGTNSTQIATMEAVQTAITNLIGGAPGALDTLKELADAINDDSSFAATVTAALAVRLRVDAAQGLNSTQQTQGQTNLGLGSAATKTVGNSAGNVVTLDGSAKLPAVDASQLTNLNLSGLAYAAGQCRLILSGSNVALMPTRGNLLTVNGVLCTIPDAGVTLAPTGLAAGTLYYVYATASAGVINALEASTTGHSTDTTAGNKGVEIKTGDSTRTLVGMVRPVAGPAFADTSTQRFVRSWFNRKPLGLRSQFAAIRSVAVSASFSEINSEVRQEFLIWADESVSSISAGSMFSNGSTPGYAILAIGLDGIVNIFGRVDAFGSSSQVFPYGAMAEMFNISEGYHYLTLAGSAAVNATNYGVANNFGGFSSRVSV